MTENVPERPAEGLKSSMANAGIAPPSRPSGASTGAALNIWIQRYKDMAARAREFEDKNTELEQLFDAQWKADARAIKMWQDAHPDQQHIWPDRANMVVWLLEKLDALTVQACECGSTEMFSATLCHACAASRT